ncbi:MAG TPA: tRNA (adenosine(37)-N6)-threonylcarbamoyltransferase complex ATPase subunit type 1 TsaE [Ignavibacteriaceae bacterium]|nr:tRNA (adenosine(37)-N6)-threonylcarbamoyltransferase complex ATPase subunit type 1 TsaE [Ignavibacteriaceae bacterium]
MAKIIEVHSEEETRKLSLEFASGLKDGDIIVLNGSLGAGKTFFIREACRYFDINTVNSPTFALINVYNGKNKIYHFDFYRIEKIEELYDIGFDDYMNDEESISFIEWGNLFPEILPEKRIEINILTGIENNRTFEIRNNK